MEDALAEMRLEGPPPGSRRTGDLLLSIVVPIYDEESVLEAFHSRLAAVLGSGSLPPAEILYVNDGSRDRSLAILERLGGQDPRVGIVDLSRNFGKEIAMSAGL